MFIAIIWAAITTTLFTGTKVYEDCKQRDFEPQACYVSKKMNEAGK